ncbi:MAG: hypothetical protein AAGU21_13030 [Solidesulfovibrio sp.]|uniref:hypothetical protein n=1 Tax=Solidesulfovibrio sp. TaxID=2910990 RepID=UPI002B2024BB|nr:hypothetical protein [Solidesulfovibrio sp.]MEA4856329.1 hypothetical protein [Solidesulfovibrio sp.]
MRSTATKVLAGLLLFASGAVTGFFGSRLLAERGRFDLFHGDPRHFSEMVVRRLSDDLDLSAEQREKLRPIVLNTGDVLAKIRRDQEPKVREAIDRSIEDTRAILTPEQREKFTALMDRLEKRRKAMERFGPPPGPPGMGPPPGPPPGGPGLDPGDMGGFPPPPPGFGGPPPGPGLGPPPDWGDGPPPGHPWPKAAPAPPEKAAPGQPAPPPEPAPKSGA